MLPFYFYFLSQHLQTQYDSLFPTLCNDHPDIFPREVYTWEQFLWACELWYSNSMQVMFPDGKLRTCLIPIAGFLNHSVCHSFCSPFFFILLLCFFFLPSWLRYNFRFQYSWLYYWIQLKLKVLKVGYQASPIMLVKHRQSTEVPSPVFDTCQRNFRHGFK